MGKNEPPFIFEPDESETDEPKKSELDKEEVQEVEVSPIAELAIRSEEALDDKLAGEGRDALEVEVAVPDIDIAMKEVGHYLTGKTRDVPQVVLQAATDAKKKLRFITPFILISSMARMSKASLVLQRLERDIFNMDEIKDMDYTAKVDFYKTMSKTHTEELEAMRRFMFQNKDLVDSMGVDSDEESLAKALRSLDPDKLARLRALLAEMAPPTPDD